jgi:hypothetical protein
MPNAAKHGLPHLPQLLGSIKRFLQFVPQSECPGRHVALALHVAGSVVASHVTARGSHVRPHAPQLPGVVSSASQPSIGFMLQSARPGGHSKRHTPLAQTGISPGRAGHSIPHLPQLELVSSRVSQPLSGLPSQSPKLSATQRTRHAPATHIGDALGAEEHRVPQPPQCTTDVVVSTHVGPHRVCPVGQAGKVSGVTTSTGGGTTSTGGRTVSIVTTSTGGGGSASIVMTSTGGGTASGTITTESAGSARSIMVLTSPRIAPSPPSSRRCGTARKNVGSNASWQLEQSAARASSGESLIEHLGKKETEVR